jgi:nucleotide-binding universal stress UspA family protein
LKEIESTDVNLVVLGVDRIPGEHLNFGGVAAAVLKNSRASVLLVSTGEAPRKDAEK